MKRKGEKERSSRRKGGQEKKEMVALLVFIIATLAEKNCWTQKVRLVITLSIIQLYIYIYTRFHKGWHFRNIYIFFVLFRETKEKTKDIYIFPIRQPLWKRVYINLSRASTLPVLHKNHINWTQMKTKHFLFVWDLYFECILHSSLGWLKNRYKRRITKFKL